MADELNEDGTPKTPTTTTETPPVVAEAAKVAEAVKAAEATAEAARKAAEERAAADRAAAGSTDSELIKKLVQDRLDAELAGIKNKLNESYTARDQALVRVAEFERKEREANLKRLQDEGKYKEAFELQLAEQKAANAELAKRNTELSRDVAVREALRNLQFRTGKAEAMAFQDITSQLVQDENKQWVHRSGVSIHEFVDAFSKDEDQSFLFKPKANSGAGTTTGANGAAAATQKPKSLFEMSQAEVLKMAAEGKLGKLPTV